MKRLILMFYGFLALCGFFTGFLFKSFEYGFIYFLFWGIITPLVLYIETRATKITHDQN